MEFGDADDVARALKPVFKAAGERLSEALEDVDFDEDRVENALRIALWEAFEAGGRYMFTEMNLRMIEWCKARGLTWVVPELRVPPHPPGEAPESL